MHWLIFFRRREWALFFGIMNSKLVTTASRFHWMTQFLFRCAKPVLDKLRSISSSSSILSQWNDFVTTFPYVFTSFFFFTNKKKCWSWTYACSWVSRWWTSSFRLFTIDTSSSSNRFSRCFCSAVFCHSSTLRIFRNSFCSNTKRRPKSSSFSLLNQTYNVFKDAK